MVKAIVQSLDGIPDGLKGEYKPLEGGGFFLDVEGVESHPHVGALKRAKEREATDATTFKAQLAEANAKLATLTEEHGKLSTEFENRLRGAVGSKEEDLARLDKSWGEKLNKSESERDRKLAQRDAALNKVLVRDAARAIVAKMNPADPAYVDVILPHVQSRLAVEIVGEEAHTRVLDDAGKPSADSIDELTEHFRVDKRFSPLLTGSKASGGSANGGNAANGNSSAVPTKIDLSKTSLADKVKHYEALNKANGQE